MLVRADLNVPLEGSEITDDGRIRASLPTLQALLVGGARVVVTAHLGRPKGAPESKYSLAPAATRLAELLGQDVPLADDFVGPSAKQTVAALGDGQVAMLENVRFDARETAKDDAERGALADDLVPGRWARTRLSSPTGSAWCTASRRRCTTSPNGSRTTRATSCPTRSPC